MTVVIISKINWNVQTVRNVSSITVGSTNVTVVGDSTVAVNKNDYYVRIME